MQIYGIKIELGLRNSQYLKIAITSYLAKPTTMAESIEPILPNTMTCPSGIPCSIIACELDALCRSNVADISKVYQRVLAAGCEASLRLQVRRASHFQLAIGVIVRNDSYLLSTRTHHFFCDQSCKALIFTARAGANTWGQPQLVHRGSILAILGVEGFDVYGSGSLDGRAVKGLGDELGHAIALGSKIGDGGAEWGAAAGGGKKGCRSKRLIDRMISMYVFNASLAVKVPW